MASPSNPHSRLQVDPYRELFERSADAILIIEGETFVDCNQATVDMLRYDERAHLLRTHPSELSPPTQPDGRDSREKANEMIAIAFERGSHRFEWAHLRADGVVIPVEVLLTAVQRDGQRILHVVWRDLTERKALEEELRHAQKMEAIGKLAGGIAHDFNNLLVAILGNSELLTSSLVDRPDQLALVSEITRAGERASSLVSQLLTFSRKREVHSSVFDTNALLSHLQSFLQRLIGEHIRLVTIPASESVCVRMDPGQFEQLVVNLVTNSRDALPAGGTVTVEVRRLELTAEVVGSFGELEPGSYAILSVSDNGIGMHEEVASRAFEPFFTTKEIGKGTGLGLATVYGIAKQAGGIAEIYSAAGKGATVKVALPLATGEEQLAPLCPAVLPTEGGQERILLVEDERAVSDFVLRVLESKGYRLQFAKNGAQALRLWQEAQEPIDLVLSDVVMPVMSGPELVRQIRQQGGSPRVIFTSGYTNNALAALEEHGDEIDLLEKPFSARELIGRVRLALDSSPATPS